jgi:hypothetical protein
MRTILECFCTLASKKNGLTPIPKLQRQPPKLAASQNRSCGPIVQKIATVTSVVNTVATGKLCSCSSSGALGNRVLRPTLAEGLGTRIASILWRGQSLCCLPKDSVGADVLFDGKGQVALIRSQE